jgi:hypothetical protein
VNNNYRKGDINMKKLYVIAFALMVLLSMTLSALALQYKQKTLDNGGSASATWSDSSSNTDLSVYSSQGQTFFYLTVCDSVTCKVGYPLGNVVLDINKQLKTATLSPVQIQLYDINTGTYEISTIQAQWTGTGDPIKGSYTTTSKSGDYTTKFSSDTAYRSATATGAINSLQLGTSQSATISWFKSVSITKVK